MLADRGRMLGKYQLIAEIARGGMGVVHLAMVQGPGGFNKLLVVKELKPELVEEPAFLTMFLDEARLAARLNHPNIVQTNEVGNDRDRYFMAMDYLDGRGLDQVRRRTKVAGFGLSVSMQLRVICDMLAGLEYAHNLTDFDGTPLHIVHRDVSPQNVFITFDGQIKLLDFGIAKASDSMHETPADVVKGKVSYMSPEQGRGQKVDARADVFSAGVLLWEALTGKRMREGKNDQEKLWALVSAEVPRASSVRSSVPPELDRICAQAMAWNRDERYASAGAMQHDLERYLTAAGANVSAREVGGCVTELFREDRANTNGVIEAHVARARGGAAREKLPIIDVASRLGVGNTRVPKPPTSRHVILFLAANPTGTTRLALDDECAAIERELRMSTGRDDFDFRSKWAVSIDEMMRHLNELQPTVIHFSGHGGGSTAITAIYVRDEKRQPHRHVGGVTTTGIQLQGEQHEPQHVSARALTQMIKSAAPSACLVVLNACFTDAVAGALRGMIDCVVGMRGAIGDDAARSFAIGFYRALGHRRSIGNAVAQAVATLAAKGLPDEHLPICLTRDGISADHVTLPRLDPHPV